MIVKRQAGSATTDSKLSQEECGRNKLYNKLFYTMYSLCNPVSETILKKVFSLWSVCEKLAGNVAVLPSINNKVKKEEKEIFRPNSSSRQEFYHFQSEHVNDNNFMRAVAAVGLGGIRKLNKIIKMWSWSSSRLRHSSPLSRQAAWWSWRKLAEERNPDFNQQFLEKLSPPESVPLYGR